jgi:hypothetical protein
MEGSWMTDAELAAIESRANAAMPGPWYARDADDDHCARAQFVGTRRTRVRVKRGERGAGMELAAGLPGQEPPDTVVAITFLQYPGLAECNQHDENTEFIAHAREDVPRLVAEIRRLRAELENARRFGP